MVHLWKGGGCLTAFNNHSPRFIYSNNFFNISWNFFLIMVICINSVTFRPNAVQNTIFSGNEDGTVWFLMFITLEWVSNLEFQFLPTLYKYVSQFSLTLLGVDILLLMKIINQLYSVFQLDLMQLEKQQSYTS